MSDIKETDEQQVDRAIKNRDLAMAQAVREGTRFPSMRRMDEEAGALVIVDHPACAAMPKLDGRLELSLSTTATRDVALEAVQLLRSKPKAEQTWAAYPDGQAPERKVF